MAPQRRLAQGLLQGLGHGLASGSSACSVSPQCRGAQLLWQAARQFSSGAAPRSSGWKALLRDYKQLSKAKLSALVVLTGAAGFVAGSEESIDWAKLGWTSLGTFGAAACANTLNQVYEVVNDGMMKRTQNRPLPAGRMGRLHALGFAAVMGAAGLGILATQTNGLTTALGAANIVLYAAAYTPLKQLTVANTWVGAVVGAIPPLMGWAAAAGQLEPGAWLLAGVLFSWQMPHFMALAYLCRDDYARAGYRMLSMFDPLGRRTGMCALRHSLLLLPAGLLAAGLHLTSAPFAGEAGALAAAMAFYSARFVRQPSAAAARQLFRSSLVYLPLLLAALAAHRLPNDHSVSWASLQQALQRGAAVAATQRHGEEQQQQQEEEEEEQQQREARGGWLGAALAPLRRVGEVWCGMLDTSREVIEVSRSIKCPSRAYGEVDGEAAAQEQGQQREQDAAAAAGQQQEEQQQQQPGRR